MSNIEPRFGAQDVITLAARLGLQEASFLVGGQATNLWAWYYRDRTPELQFDAPLTSRDVDYFGSARVARAAALALGGRVITPDTDTMNSPNTAVVLTTHAGQPLLIDFLNGVLGVTRRELETGVALIRVETGDETEQTVEIAVMHPVLCLKSRVANMLHPATRRRDAFAWRQLHAAVATVPCYIGERLDHGDWAEAKLCLSEIFAYLRSDPMARRVRAELGIDLTTILHRFRDDVRIDVRYRAHQVAGMIDRLALRKPVEAANA